MASYYDLCLELFHRFHLKFVSRFATSVDFTWLADPDSRWVNITLSVLGADVFSCFLAVDSDLRLFYLEGELRRWEIFLERELQ